MSGLLSGDLVIFRGEKLLNWREKKKNNKKGGEKKKKIMPSRLNASPITNICVHTTDATL